MHIFNYYLYYLIHKIRKKKKSLILTGAPIVGGGSVKLCGGCPGVKLPLGVLCGKGFALVASPFNFTGIWGGGWLKY